MLIRVEYEGDNLQNDLKKMSEVSSKIEKATGGKIEGPYLRKGYTSKTFCL